jgi:hypothetical protein
LVGAPFKVRQLNLKYNKNARAAVSAIAALMLRRTGKGVATGTESAGQKYYFRMVYEFS